MVVQDIGLVTGEKELEFLTRLIIANMTRVCGSPGVK